jgi:hypothetical protein
LQFLLNIQNSPLNSDASRLKNIAATHVLNTLHQDLLDEVGTVSTCSTLRSLAVLLLLLRRLTVLLLLLLRLAILSLLLPILLLLGLTVLLLTLRLTVLLLLRLAVLALLRLLTVLTLLRLLAVTGGRTRRRGKLTRGGTRRGGRWRMGWSCVLTVAAGIYDNEVWVSFQIHANDSDFRLFRKPI